ncbi:unnamed protein product, partial [Amoebophrya sp. A120]|eukprot:GSA120T00012304001.1
MTGCEYERHREDTFFITTSEDELVEAAAVLSSLSRESQQLLGTDAAAVVANAAKEVAFYHENAEENGEAAASEPVKSAGPHYAHNALTVLSAAGKTPGGSETKLIKSSTLVDGWCFIEGAPAEEKKINRGTTATDSVVASTAPDSDKNGQEEVVPRPGYYFNPFRFRLRRNLPRELKTHVARRQRPAARRTVHHMHYDNAVFSHFEYTYRSWGKAGSSQPVGSYTFVRKEPIEPLIGHLRHPLAGCESLLPNFEDGSETEAGIDAETSSYQKGGAAGMVEPAAKHTDISSTKGDPTSASFPEAFFVQDPSFVLPVTADSVLLPRKNSSAAAGLKLYFDFGAGQYSGNVSRTFASLASTWERSGNFEFDAMEGWEPGCGDHDATYAAAAKIIEPELHSDRERAPLASSTPSVLPESHEIGRIKTQRGGEGVEKKNDKKSDKKPWLLGGKMKELFRDDFLSSLPPHLRDRMDIGLTSVVLHQYPIAQFPERRHQWLPSLLQARGQQHPYRGGGRRQ